MSIAKLSPLDSPTATMPIDLASLEAWFDRRLDEKLAEREAAKIPSLALIATKGTMDMAYPPFILFSSVSHRHRRFLVEPAGVAAALSLGAREGFWR